jgi:LysM repeat protein
MRRGLLVSAVLTLAVAACSGSSSPAPSTSVSGSPSSAPSSAPSAAPKSPSPAPAASPSPSPSAGGVVYIVKKGDTLFAIAASHKTTIQAILTANPSITNPNVLKIGQRIVIPAS